MAGEVRSGDETTETGDAGEVGERIWELRWTVERVLALVCVFKAGERRRTIGRRKGGFIFYYWYK